MGRGKYSVLLMRDDKGVKSFQLSPGWIKLFLYFIIVLVAVAGVASYGAVRFYQESQLLKQERVKLMTQLNQQRVEIERLQNVERMLEMAEDEEMEELVGSISPPEPPVVETPPPPLVDLAEVFNHVDLFQVNVENLQARFSGESMNVQFDLNNMQTGNAMSGIVDVGLVSREGEFFAVDARDDDLSFTIQRFKHISTTFPLPEPLTRENVFGVRLIIRNDEDKVIYRETYPLHRILSS